MTVEDLKRLLTYYPDDCEVRISVELVETDSIIEKQFELRHLFCENNKVLEISLVEKEGE